MMAGARFPGLPSLDPIKSAQMVSGLTGGQYSGVQTAAAALASIDSATRSIYVLGYHSTNATLDGRYRGVEVKVRRRGVTVLFPHGYTARPDLPPVNTRELMTRTRLRDAAETDVAQNDIRIQVHAAAAAPSLVKVDLVIDANKLSLSGSGQRREGAIDVLILCGDAKQQVIGKIDQHMNLALDDSHYRQAMSGGIPYSVTVPVTGRPSFVRVVVYEYEGDHLGTQNVAVK